MSRSLVSVLALFCSSVAVVGADPAPGATILTATYAVSAGEERTIEVHLPAGHDPGQDRVPGMIFFHGGGWTSGAPAQFRDACVHFASLGLVTATVEYRLVKAGEGATLPPGTSYKEPCVEDARAAIRWFRDHADEFGVDPARLVVAGGSAGAHVGALATLAPAGGEAGGEKIPVAAFVWFNPAFEPADSRFAAVDVMRHLGPGMPPMIAFYGDRDLKWLGGWNPVEVRLKGLGADLEVWMAPGMEHGFFNREPWKSRTLARVGRFLSRHGLLDNFQPGPEPEDGLVRR